MATKIGLIGASGMLGKHLANGIIANKAYTVSLITRKGGKGEALKPFKAQGAQIVEVDFEDNADLTAGLTGLDIVVSAVGTEGLAGQPKVIAAAKAAGVRRFVPSEFGVDLSLPGIREYLPLLGLKTATRDALEASGLEYTYVIPGFFTESSFIPPFGFDIAGGKVTLKGNADTTFALTSLVDIGRWTAAALLDPASKNATVYLKGEDMTMNKAVQIIEASTGKKLEVSKVSAADLDAAIAAAPSPFAAFLDVLLKAVSDGWVTVPSDKLWAGADKPTVTLASHAKATFV